MLVTSMSAAHGVKRLRFRLVPITVLLVVTAAAEAQTSADEVVIYRECLRPPERTAWGRFPECGVDEEATRKLRDELDANRRPLTPREEQQVDRLIDERFAVPVRSARQAELLTLVDWTVRRIDRVLENDTYLFTPESRADLQQTLAELEQRLVAATERALSRDELETSIADVGEIVVRVTAILSTTPREIPPASPRIENLVTRIDALVARVGTVIRDMENERLAVPRAIRDGHAHALELVRESKRTCSTRRPASCRNLSEVLETIAAMREPLCSLKSNILASICNGSLRHR